MDAAAMVFQEFERALLRRPLRRIGGGGERNVQDRLVAPEGLTPSRPLVGDASPDRSPTSGLSPK